MTEDKTKILLVFPRNPVAGGVWQLNRHPLINRRAFILPLGIATLAGLTPEAFTPSLWDENFQGPIGPDTVLPPDLKLVAVSGYSLHHGRVLELAAEFKRRRLPAVAGGPGVTADPEAYQEFFSTLLLGEGENIWPEFLHDWQQGRPRDVYEERGRPELSLRPPRWDGLGDNLGEQYLLGAVQNSRGCPFRCEFCSNWKLFGNRMRLKPIPAVLAEIDNLRRLGLYDIAFNVDNFAGDPAYTEKLLQALIEYNQNLERPVRFRCEVSLNIARDPGLLRLFNRAGAAGLFIGLESPNPESLKETGKKHNLRADMAADCRLIMAGGIPVDGSLIVGFDHDDAGIFSQQFEFIQKALIPNPKMHLLRAIPGTDLWQRLMTAGRIIDLSRLDSDRHADSEQLTNILPARMSRIELFSGYAELLARIVDWHHFLERLRGFVDNAVDFVAPPAAATGSQSGRGRQLLEILPAEFREPVGKLLAETARRRPGLENTVAILVVRNHADAEHFSSVRAAIARQIERERNLSAADYQELVL